MPGCRYLSGDWTALVIGGGEWEIRVTVNLTRREDTGQINSSPVTALFGEVHLQHGCNQTVKIPGITSLTYYGCNAYCM